MPSGKLSLDLAALRVKSFETTASPSGGPGTVQGMDCTQCTHCTACSACTQCTNSCGQMTWCIGSCHFSCTNASQTDSGCQESDGGSCFDTSCLYGTCEYQNTCYQPC